MRENLENCKRGILLYFERVFFGKSIIRMWHLIFSSILFYYLLKNDYTHHTYSLFFLQSSFGILKGIIVYIILTLTIVCIFSPRVRTVFRTCSFVRYKKILVKGYPAFPNVVSNRIHKYGHNFIFH